ncbi:MAG: thioredoxin domain-containing protein [Anaerolineae bacterium]|nr:thioredoxin domain-containing protein [Anaerolineae bacterium]
MIRRFPGWLVAVVIAITLIAGPGFTHAQTSPDLMQRFTWQPYGLTISYPDGWTVVEAGGVISLYPEDRDVSDGQGPELILFTLPVSGSDPLDTAAAQLAADIGGEVSPITAGTRDGRATRQFTFDQAAPDTIGGLLLIAADDQTVLVLAHTVRDSEADVFLPLLEAMTASATFEASGNTSGGLVLGGHARTLETYRDDTYGYTLQYPRTWSLVTRSKPGEIALYPPNADIGLNAGPEFVIVVFDTLAVSDLDEVLNAVLSDRPGEFSEPQTGTLNDHPTRFVSYTNDTQNPAVTGAIFLVQVSDSVVIASGYRAPSDSFATHQPMFEAIQNSLSFESGAPVVTAGFVSTSNSVSSVQLEQRFSWSDGALALYLPEDWQAVIEWDGEAEANTLFASAPGTLYDDTLQMLHGTTLDWFPGLDLRVVAEATTFDYEKVSDIVDITVAGHPAVTYTVLDDSEEPTFKLQIVVLKIEDKELGVVMIFGTTESGWDTFRPVVDAIIASIEPLDSTLSLRPVRVTIPSGKPLPWQQDDDYYWDEFGVTLRPPDDWQTITTTQNFDLALVAPDINENPNASFVGFQYIAFLGADTTPADVLAEQFGGDAQPYTIDGREGAILTMPDEANGTTQYLILVPYDDHGAAFFIVTLSKTGEEAAVESILDSMTIAPVHVDYSVVDAAWQASLAEYGTLSYGSPDAPVKMAEFLDFACGHCANYSQDVERLYVLEADGDRLHVEVNLMDIIGGPISNQAAQATYCAVEQGKGYTAYKTLFDGYHEKGYDYAYSREGISELLGNPDYELDIDALNTCIDDGTYNDIIQENAVRWAAAGGTGTPSVLLGANGDSLGFLILPDGSNWSGGIPTAVVRDITGRMIADNISAQDAFNALIAEN